MTEQEMRAFNDKMFGLIVTSLQELPLEKMIELHDELVDQIEETEGSNQEAPVSFALTAVHEAIRVKQISRLMN